jgi:hypothetical protein
MKPQLSMLRSSILLAAGVAGLAAFASIARDGQSPCTAISPSTSCTFFGSNAYFSSDASGTISNDTMNLNTGAVYIEPSLPLFSQAARRGHVILARGNAVRLFSPAAGATPTATYYNISYADSAVVGLLQGTLSQPSTLQPGCQITYTTAGTSTESNIPQPDSLLGWFATTFSITLPNIPSPNCN